VGISGGGEKRQRGKPSVLAGKGIFFQINLKTHPKKNSQWGGKRKRRENKCPAAKRKKNLATIYISTSHQPLEGVHDCCGKTKHLQEKREFACVGGLFFERESHRGISVTGQLIKNVFILGDTKCPVRREGRRGGGKRNVNSKRGKQRLHVEKHSLIVSSREKDVGKENQVLPI